MQVAFGLREGQPLEWDEACQGRGDREEPRGRGPDFLDETPMKPPALHQSPHRGSPPRLVGLEKLPLLIVQFLPAWRTAAERARLPRRSGRLAVLQGCQLALQADELGPLGLAVLF